MLVLREILCFREREIMRIDVSKRRSEKIPQQRNNAKRSYPGILDSNHSDHHRDHPADKRIQSTDFDRNHSDHRTHHKRQQLRQMTVGMQTLQARRARLSG